MFINDNTQLNARVCTYVHTACTRCAYFGILTYVMNSRMFGCSWSTVQQAVKAVVAYGRERQELDGLTHIGVDEIARKRGHVYMTVVYDLKKSRLVWVGDGRTRETLERFFDFLGEDGSKRLEAVCCDWRSYVNAVRARAAGAHRLRQVPHRGHLGKAVDDVRREEIREKGQAHKDLVKNSRYLWLKNPWNLTGGQAERLRQAEHGSPPGLPAEGDVPPVLGVQASWLGQALPQALVAWAWAPVSRRCGSSPARCSATWTTFSTTFWPGVLGASTLQIDQWRRILPRTHIHLRSPC